MRGASSLPIAVEPVAETSGIRSSSASCTARSAPPSTSSKSPFGHVAEPLGRALEEPCRRDRAERRPLGRLPEHRVAADERERRVPAPHGDGEVERADDGDRAERVPGLGQAVARALGGDRAAVELAREADREVADVDHLLHLAEALLLDLPDLERDERAERLLLATQLLAEQPHELAAPRAGTSRHASNAVTARATAAAVSSASVRCDATELLARDRRADDEVAVAGELLVDAEAREERRCGALHVERGHGAIVGPWWR